MEKIEQFGSVAKSLAKNPLGIIALFIVLVYGFATLLLGLKAGNLTQVETLPLVYFLIIFPVLVLFLFGWLVSKHHEKLYSPKDHNVDDFRKTFDYKYNFQKLPFADPQENYNIKNEEMSLASSNVTSEINLIKNRSDERIKIYEENRGIFLSHLLEPTKLNGQVFEIFIFLVRHKNNEFNDIEKVDFFFGDKWGNKIFEAKKIKNLIGIRTAAYGPFLCTCYITFKDKKELTLYRYIDFSMRQYLSKSVKDSKVDINELALG